MPKYSITIDYYAQKPFSSDSHFVLKEGKEFRGLIRDCLILFKANELIIPIANESKTVKR
jgi:hypothetical protein